jgi:sugar phosphate isomerase/epimerase
MLLTLSASCLRSLLLPGRTGKIRLNLLDLPQVTRDELGLHGLNMSTALLTGIGRDTLERLRDRADKAGCACLLLTETDPQPFGHASEATGSAAIERLERVIEAGHLLGCSCVAVKVSANADDPAALTRTIVRLRRAVMRAERLEMNVLIAPGDGLTRTAERVTELIKKVGGFRVGTFPDFQAAATSPNPVAYMRKLTPYAAAICASTVKFTDGKTTQGECRHAAYDLEPLVKAVLAVGYDGTMAVEYRGTGDAKLGVVRSREALERLLSVDSSAGVGVAETITDEPPEESGHEEED